MPHFYKHVIWVDLIEMTTLSIRQMVFGVIDMAIYIGISTNIYMVLGGTWCYSHGYFVIRAFVHVHSLYSVLTIITCRHYTIFNIKNNKQY